MHWIAASLAGHSSIPWAPLGPVHVDLKQIAVALPEKRLELGTAIITEAQVPKAQVPGAIEKTVKEKNKASKWEILSNSTFSGCVYLWMKMNKK